MGRAGWGRDTLMMGWSWLAYGETVSGLATLTHHRQYFDTLSHYLFISLHYRQLFDSLSNCVALLLSLCGVVVLRIT